MPLSDSDLFKGAVLDAFMAKGFVSSSNFRTDLGDKVKQLANKSTIVSGGVKALTYASSSGLVASGGEKAKQFFGSAYSALYAGGEKAMKYASDSGGEKAKQLASGAQWALTTSGERVMQLATSTGFSGERAKQLASGAQSALISSGEKAMKLASNSGYNTEKAVQLASGAKQFVDQNRTAILAGGAAIAAVALAPELFFGLAGTIGFAGIGKRDIASLILSLQGNMVAGTLVAVLQMAAGSESVSKGTLATMAGGTAITILASHINAKFDANAKGLEELNVFISIRDESCEADNAEEKTAVASSSDAGVQPKVIFDLHRQLLSNHAVLAVFLNAFDAAKKFSNAKKFDFLVVREDEVCAEGCKILYEHFLQVYGNGHVRAPDQGCYVVDLNTFNTL